MEENDKKTAERWAEVLGERKVHVVGAVLALVGEDAMGRIADSANDAWARGDARSVGGAFMNVLRTIVVVSHTGHSETLHDAAKRLSGEKEYQRKRIKNKKNNKTRVIER